MTKRPMSFDELPLVLTAAETARFLMVPPSAVYAHMRSGQLKSVRVGKWSQKTLQLQFSCLSGAFKTDHGKVCVSLCEKTVHYWLAA